MTELVAGEAMEKVLRNCCRSIRIGKILIRRDQESRKPRVGTMRPDISARPSDYVQWCCPPSGVLCQVSTPD